MVVQQSNPLSVAQVVYTGGSAVYLGPSGVHMGSSAQYLPPPPVALSPAPLPASASTLTVTLDAAFARSGRDLGISAAFFSLLAFVLAIPACASPWLSFPLNGVPLSDCSISIGLRFYGVYGNGCTPAVLANYPAWGTKTVAQFCELGLYCNAGAGLFALSCASFVVVIAAAAAASSALAAYRFSICAGAGAPKQHFGTTLVCV